VTSLSDGHITTLLGEIGRNAPDAGELHRLEVLFRHLGPAQARRTDLVARVTAAGARAHAAVRGTSRLHMVEVEAGSHRVMLELRPTGRPTTVEIHGQVFAPSSPDQGSLAVLSWGAGELRTSPVDDHGEFHFPGVPTGTYRITWHLGGDRIVLPAMTVDGGEVPTADGRAR
jgi:hypothetical protein